jgi:excisionase family DNA binding protein
MERFPVARSKSKIPLTLAPVGLRPKQAAAALGISVSYLYLLMKRGKIPSRTLGAARLFLPADLEAFAASLLVAEPDVTSTGPLLPVAEQKVAVERVRARVGRKPPPRPPRPDIDLAAIYDGRRRLLAPEIGPIEARRGAYQFTVQACARHFSIELDEAERRTLAALAECGWLEPNPGPSGEAVS